MSAPPLASRFPRLRRLLGRLAGIVVILVVTIVGGLVWEWWVGSTELRKAVAETDAASPGWRMADLEAARPELPPGDDSVVVLTGLADKLPENWPGQNAPKSFGVTPGEPSPQAKLTPEQRADLEAAIALKAELLPAIRTLADLPRGRHRFDLTPDVLSTRLAYAQRTRAVARLLEYRAALDADAGVGEPLRDCRAILNAGRSLDGDPFSISALVRIAVCRVGTLSAERVLARTEPPEAELAALQAICEREAAADVASSVVRGERAAFDALFTNLETGRVGVTDLAKTASDADVPLTVWLTAPYIRVRTYRDHAAFLRMMNRAEAVAARPTPEQSTGIIEWAESVKDAPTFTKLLLPAYAKAFQATVRHKAHMRSAAVALACERYRRANGRWPNALADLSPAFVTAVPEDPYDGRPLRLGRLPDGPVVYSVGADGTDNDGTLDPKMPDRPGADLGFRLFDAVGRRGE